MSLLLGIDIGSTVTKASLFDHNGALVATGCARCTPVHPYPGWAERDMTAVWRAAAEAIRICLSAMPPGRTVAGVGIVGHSDGLYAIDQHGRPVRNAIMATDSRATDTLARWRAQGIMPELLTLTGTEPFAASPATLLAWLADHEPSALDRARWFFAAKDWVRFRLTGHVGTEPTDGSGSFLGVRSRTWSPESLALFGLTTVASKLPPLVEPSTVIGVVSAEAAAETGLDAGTPVVAGAHDVDGAALGMAAHQVGALSVVIGTFSINQIVTDDVTLGVGWQLRQFLAPDQWLAMSTSPASATNLDWYAATLGTSDFAALVGSAETVRDEELGPYFLPFLNGGAGFAAPAGAFVGLGSHHSRAHLVRAILRGVIANHRSHVESLAAGFALPDVVRVGGGGARSAYWTQLLADALGRRVLVSDSDETARGAALLAGLGTGIFPDLPTAANAANIVRSLEPDPAGAELFDAYYASYQRAVLALRSFPKGA